MSPLIHVYALPKFADPEALARGTVVVIDVLRATTTIIYALQAGAKAVIPCREIDEARQIAKRFPPHEKILGGERGGLPIDGFDLGNSPEDYTPDRVQGKTVVFTTTNGTQALLHAKKAKQILLGAFVNASAVAQHLFGQEEVHLLCAGTDGQPTDEDILLAGMLAKKLQRQGGAHYELNAEAIAACDLWRHTLEIIRGDCPDFRGHHAGGMVVENGTVPFRHRPTTEPPWPEPLAKILRHSLGGANLASLAMDRDILAAARIDRFAIVPKFNPETSCIQAVR
jgi:2-phosphosulfolactate phosphatase